MSKTKLYHVDYTFGKGGTRVTVTVTSLEAAQDVVLDLVPGTTYRMYGEGLDIRGTIQEPGTEMD